MSPRTQWQHTNQAIRAIAPQPITAALGPQQLFLAADVRVPAAL
eukprot:CAMPEP_0202866886 /NCGR_PEP_ID=MMETSP1391-20130828/8412_1 /ASSEMBLY_ACC=CAM_ASM_000867 /TAXON_ID=1034604 /ORGANISM="Chlamydomonas leiostraca, Strain SAG 11-49" /LENGTH=43 /DNA_ID= /DNA_START= /DNA_END= /DNA_ORIENTATION=